jgi:adenylosuccinate lyase
MNYSPLTALTPLDGRYHSQTQALRIYFSEFALIRYRVHIEVEYFIALSQTGLQPLTPINPSTIGALREIVDDFSESDAQAIKERERITNHDVKAVEYFLKEKLDALNLGDYREFVHFGLTSQDINNTAIPLSIKEFHLNYFNEALESVIKAIDKLSQQCSNIPMLARTHGQPASPTLLEKELYVFVERLKQQVHLLQAIPFAAKFGGATGNMNAHVVAYPDYDWKAFARDFVENKLGLKLSYPTTQIEHYDHLAALFDAVKRMNIVLIDFCRDIWQYISMDYFKQITKAHEVGSSAMPHKVNPIDFENAEGNLGIANALFNHLSSKLPISRLQRDLTDSTVLRNVGVPYAHTCIALNSILKGIGKLIVNKNAIDKDLSENWAVVAEAIQTILRREQYPQPYEALKALTRGKTNISQTDIHEFIDSLTVKDEVKKELKQITPFNYTGTFVL